MNSLLNATKMTRQGSLPIVTLSYHACRIYANLPDVVENLCRKTFCSDIPSLQNPTKRSCSLISGLHIMKVYQGIAPIDLLIFMNSWQPEPALTTERRVR